MRNSMRNSTRKILVILAVALLPIIAAYPVLADANQKAGLYGGNAAMVKVTQIAWNYDKGTINQGIDVHVTGNYQKMDEDSLIIISDPDYDYNINNTMNGISLIKVDLDQAAKNMGSGKIYQGIDVTIEGNTQVLDQTTLFIEG